MVKIADEVWDSANGIALATWTPAAGTVSASDNVLTGMQKIDGNVTALDSRLDIEEPKVSTLQSEMVVAKSDILVLDSRLDAAEPKISTLESEMVVVKSEMVVAKSDIVVAKSDILVLDSRLDVAEPKVSTLQSEMIVAKSDILVLDSRLDAEEPKVSTLQSEMIVVKSEMVVAKSDIVVLDSRLDVEEPKVSTLQSEMVVAKSDIVVAKSDILVLDSRLDVAEPKVSTLESEMVVAKSDIVVAKSDIAVLQGSFDKIFVTLTSGGVTAGDIVYVASTGKVLPADSDAEASCVSVIGIADATVADDSPVKVQVAGKRAVKNASFAGNIGKRVYVSGTAGEGTLTAPEAVNSVVFLIGHSISATEIVIQPHLEAVND
jgi:capsule polysaccharide export protein KpsE/RkpR